MLGCVRAELAVGLDQAADVARRAGDVPDLDVVRRQRRRGLPEAGAQLVALRAPLVAGIDEPLPEELELQVAQAVVVEERGDLVERSGFEDVLEVGVPEADPAEADPGRVLAAVAQVEEAPFAALVDVDRP